MDLGRGMQVALARHLTRTPRLRHMTRTEPYFVSPRQFFGGIARHCTDRLQYFITARGVTVYIVTFDTAQELADTLLLGAAREDFAKKVGGRRGNNSISVVRDMSMGQGLEKGSPLSIRYSTREHVMNANTGRVLCAGALSITFEHRIYGDTIKTKSSSLSSGKDEAKSAASSSQQSRPAVPYAGAPQLASAELITQAEEDDELDWLLATAGV